MIIRIIWHHRQTGHFFITAVRHAECVLYTFNIAGGLVPSILDLRTHNFPATFISTFVGHWLWKLTMLFENILREILRNFPGQFWNYAPLKFVPFFGPTNIYCDNEHKDLSYTNYVFVSYPFDRQDIILLAIIGKRDTSNFIGLALPQHHIC